VIIIDHEFEEMMKTKSVCSIPARENTIPNNSFGVDTFGKPSFVNFLSQKPFESSRIAQKKI